MLHHATWAIDNLFDWSICTLLGGCGAFLAVHAVVRFRVLQRRGRRVATENLFLTEVLKLISR